MKGDRPSEQKTNEVPRSFTHLSVVHHVEHDGGDDATDGVGQHEDHHPLPAPQRDFGFTGWGDEEGEGPKGGNGEDL